MLRALLVRRLLVSEVGWGGLGRRPRCVCTRERGVAAVMHLATARPSEARHRNEYRSRECRHEFGRSWQANKTAYACNAEGICPQTERISHVVDPLKPALNHDKDQLFKGNFLAKWRENRWFRGWFRDNPGNGC